VGGDSADRGAVGRVGGLEDIMGLRDRGGNHQESCRGSAGIGRAGLPDRDGVPVSCASFQGAGTPGFGGGSSVPPQSRDVRCYLAAVRVRRPARTSPSAAAPSTNPAAPRTIPRKF
jgi:hypothetical protein